MHAHRPFVTLCQISDVHLAESPETGDGSPDEGLGHAMELVAAEAPDAIVLTGDIADDGSVAACARVRSIVESLGVPILATPGNHDRPEVVRQVFGDVDEISLGAWRILGVDTTVPGQDGGRIDADAVAETLGADAGTPTVLAMHHPPLTTSTGDAFRLDGAAELIGMLSARSDVRVVMSGHLHEAFAVVLGAVNLLGGSSTYYGIEHGSDVASPTQRRDRTQTTTTYLRDATRRRPQPWRVGR